MKIEEENNLSEKELGLEIVINTFSRFKSRINAIIN